MFKSLFGLLVLVAGLARPEPCVRATVAGRALEVCRDEAERILAGVEPEPVQTRWVEVAGKRFPPKQALEAVARAKGVPIHRLDFQTMTAVSVFRRLGFRQGRADRRARPCVRARVAGRVLEVCRDEVEAVAQSLAPEPVRTHWVEAAGKRFPPKQLLEAVARAKGVPLSRLEFQTVSALSLLDRLGFALGRVEPGDRPCVRATVAGRVLEVCRDEVEAVAQSLAPEPVRTHWVEAAGKRFPPKQLLEAVARAKGVPLSRLEFTTMRARSLLRRLGLKAGEEGAR